MTLLLALAALATRLWLDRVPVTLDVRALANRLAVEYAGAVPAEEAMCRHALTEGLAHQGVV